MKVLYISSLVSNRLFDRFIENKLTTGYTGQKYHGLFAKGFAANIQNGDVTALSQPPIRKYFFSFIDCEDGVKYRYIPIIAIPVLKQIISFLFSFLYTFYWCCKNINQDKIVVCSLMRIYQYPPVKLASFPFKCKYITVACDIPWMTTLQVATRNISIKQKCAIWISKRLCSSFDGYVLLTATMNEVLNPKRKPAVVIEGFCDINMRDVSNGRGNKSLKNIILYAGGLNAKYGIENLVEAVKSMDSVDTELWLYGSGDMNDKLRSETNPRIKFWGPKSNSEVIQAELRAMILVNPRPTSDEYTRFSFPSKTLEYMVSGTYTMTTPLAGIPDEYYKYCGIIPNYTTDGIKCALQNALSLGRDELCRRGQCAKDFAINYKNNISQVAKVVSFIHAI